MLESCDLAQPWHNTVISVTTLAKLLILILNQPFIVKSYSQMDMRDILRDGDTNVENSNFLERMKSVEKWRGHSQAVLILDLFK